MLSRKGRTLDLIRPALAYSTKEFFSSSLRRRKFCRSARAFWLILSMSSSCFFAWSMSDLRASFSSVRAWISMSLRGLEAEPPGGVVWSVFGAAAASEVGFALEPPAGFGFDDGSFGGSVFWFGSEEVLFMAKIRDYFCSNNFFTSSTITVLKG